MIGKFIGWANIIFFGIGVFAGIISFDIVLILGSLMFVSLGCWLINDNEVKVEKPETPKEYAGLTKKSITYAYVKGNLHKERKVLEKDIIDMLQVSSTSAGIMVGACLHSIKQEQQEIIEFEKIVKNLPAVEHKCPPDYYKWE